MNHHQDGHNHSAIKNITLVFFLNLAFAVIELIGGFLTNSIAILSDALHDFGDSVSLGVAWYLQRIAGRGRDKYYSYGYKRFSLLGAVFISLVLLIGSGIIIWESIGRIASPQQPNAEGMLWLAVLGVIVNGLAIIRLKKGHSLSERAVMLHMLEDVLGWIAVLIVSVVMLFVDWPVLDPLLSIGISCWVLFNVYRNLKATLKILMQEVPQDIDLQALTADVLGLEGVISLHDMHLWTLDGEHHVITLHVAVSGRETLQQVRLIKCKVREICARYGVAHATIELEEENEQCELEHH